MPVADCPGRRLCSPVSDQFLALPQHPVDRGQVAPKVPFTGHSLPSCSGREHPAPQVIFAAGRVATDVAPFVKVVLFMDKALVQIALSIPSAGRVRWSPTLAVADALAPI